MELPLSTYLPTYLPLCETFFVLFYLSLKVTLRIMCQPCFSSGKETACNAGDLGLIPGLERSPGKGKGYLLQYFIFGLENSIDYSPWGCKELDMTERLSVHFCLFFSWENWSSDSLITLTRVRKSELRFEPKSLLLQSCPNIALTPKEVLGNTEKEYLLLCCKCIWKC